MTDLAYGKATKRRLRELAREAHSRELSKALAKLEGHFARWRTGEIDAFELKHRVHLFHDGISRDLFVFYRDSQPTNAVARATALGVLERDEVPPEILEHLQSAIAFFVEYVEPDEEGD